MRHPRRRRESRTMRLLANDSMGAPETGTPENVIVGNPKVRLLGQGQVVCPIDMLITLGTEPTRASTTIQCPLVKPRTRTMAPITGDYAVTDARRLLGTFSMKRPARPPKVLCKCELLVMRLLTIGFAVTMCRPDLPSRPLKLSPETSSRYNFHRKYPSESID